MIERHKSIKYVYNNRTKRYTIYIPDAIAFKDSIKILLGRSTTNNVVIKEKKDKFDIYEFFLLELEFALEKMKEERPDLAIKLGGIVLNDLMSFLKTKTWLSERYGKQAVNVLDYGNIKSKMRYNLLPHQVESFNKYETIKRMSGIRGFMLDLGAGQGKMEKNGTKVKVPNGWKAIEKLKVGDDVIGSNGRSIKVTGVYPQGKLPLVRLGYEDGRSSDIGHEHLWSVFIGTSRKAEVMKTSKIIKLLDKGIDLYLPTIDYRVNKDDVVDELPIDPYLLGVIYTSGSVPNCLNITTRHSNVMDKVKNSLDDRYRVHKDINTYGNNNYRVMLEKSSKNILKDNLLKLKLLHRYKVNITLPNVYKESSFLSRVELMKGIMESGESSFSNNTLYFKTTDIKLAKVVKELSWSLGDIASISTVDEPYALEKTIRYYHVTIRTKNAYREDMSPVTTKLKLTSYTNIPDNEATCISVSAKNKLYVTKDYIVTHNTFTSLALGEALYYNNIIIVAPSATIDDVWVKSVTKELYKSPQTNFTYTSKNKDYKKERFMIMSYESLDKIVKDKKMLNLLKRLKPMLIVDEFHNFNNINSLRTNNLLEFVNRVNFQDVALLTGTPVKMSLNELKPMLFVLDTKFKPVIDKYDDVYRNKYEMFRNRFDIYRKYVPKDTKNLPKIDIHEHKVTIPDSDRFTLTTINKEITEYKIMRLEEILSKMDIYESMYESVLNNLYMTLVEKGVSKGGAANIIKDYKRIVRQIRKFNKDKKLYKAQHLIIEARELEKENILPNLSSNDKKTFKSIISIIKYPELKVLGEALGKILLGKRIECYNELAKHLNYRNLITLTDKKAIIFSNYVSTCKTAAMTCTEQGYSPVNVYGEHIPNLPVNVKKFNDLKDKTNPIIATYKSLSTGVPLLAGNIMLLLDIPVRNYLLDQSLSRAWRIGQDRPVIVFMVKLDTGNVFNITDRDHFILNLSTQNVEMITGVSNPFEVPEQIHLSDLEDQEEETDEALLEIEEDIKNDMSLPLNSLIGGDMDNSDEDTSSMLGNLLSKFKFKL